MNINRQNFIPLYNFSAIIPAGIIGITLLATACYYHYFKKYFLKDEELLSHLQIENAVDPVVKFQEIVHKYPDRIAIKYKKSKLTFKELDDKSNIIAACLINNVKQHSNIIGIYIHCKLTAVICQLAALKAGIAFFPIDANLPKQKLITLIKELNLKWIIGSDFKHYSTWKLSNVNMIEYSALYSFNSDHYISIHTKASTPEYDTTKANYHPLNNLETSRLAYILPTSGSTSDKPKLVKQHALALTGQSTNYKKDIGFNENDVFLQIASLTHDQSIVDIYGALLNGCTLCMYDLAVLDLNDLRNFIIDNNITVYSSIPSMFTRIFEHIKKGQIQKPMYVVLGGEELSLKQFDLFKEICPDGSYFFNYHGASECSLTLFSKFTHQDSIADTIPLGFPTDKLEIKLLSDENNSDLKELCIHSPYMSSGYYNNQEQTNRAFIKIENKVFYKMGDIVEVDSNGCYHFKGRKVWYEKIDGKRIDLHEIENTLNRLDFISEAAVLCYGEDTQKKIYGFYTTKNGQPITNIRNECTEFMEDYLIPHKFIHLQQLPKLLNGKINRNELRKRLETSQIGTAPRKSKTDIEILELPLKEAVAHIWFRELDLEYAPNTDLNFIENGGTSMIAMRIINSITFYYAKKFKQVAGCSVRTIFNCNTLAKFQNIMEIEDKTWYEVSRNPATKFDIEHNKHISKEHQAIQFNLDGYKAAAQYYSHKDNISIETLNSREELVEKIEQYIKNNKDSDLKQYGFTAPLKTNIINSHPTSCILSLNNHTRNPIVFLSDSAVYGGERNLEFHTLLKSKVPNCKILIDNIHIQNEALSCQVFALLWCRAALKIDLSQKAILDTKAPTEFWSPPELLKAWQQRKEDQYGDKINWDKPLDGDKKGRTLKDIHNKYTKEITYLYENNPNLPFKKSLNTYVYSKTEKLYKIVTETCSKPSHAKHTNDAIRN